MTATQATPKNDSGQKRFKGSLAGTLVRTLLVFTFIPLAIMAGAAYFRARTLLQQQAITQSQNLLSAQLKTIDGEVTNKETQLGHLLESSDFIILTELALHANPKTNEFYELRNGILQDFNALSAQENASSFDQFLLLDADGNVKIASNPKWQGAMLDSSVLKQTEEHQSIALYGLSPIYENEFILATVQPYKTDNGSLLGSIVGITEKKNLQKLFQPLNGLSPLATIYLALSDQRFIHSDPETGEFRLVESNSQNKINSIFSELMTQNIPQPRTLDVTNPSGEDALAQLQWFPRIQTGVVFETKASDIYGQVASLLPFTIMLVLGAVLATILAIIIGNNRVIKPLRSLSDITREFADGDWSRRAEVSRNDEVGALANSFNQMADELEKSHRSLEQKVEEGERQIHTTTEVAQNITSFSNQAAKMAGTSQVDFEELARLYRSSKLIAEANTEQEILEISSQILKEAPYPVIMFHVQNKKLAVFSYSEPAKESSLPKENHPELRESNLEEIENYLLGGEVLATFNSDDIPGTFKDIMQELELESAAYLPVRKNGELTAILMIGGRNQSLSNAAMQPYINHTNLMSITMEKAEAIQQTKKHLHTAEALTSITEAISTSSSQQVFFTALHSKLQEIIGDYKTSVALYDEKSNTISIPFNYEDGKNSIIESFSLGERFNIHLDSYKSTIDACGRY